jgi:hypothetical protein
MLVSRILGKSNLDWGLQRKKVDTWGYQALILIGRRFNFSAVGGQLFSLAFL